MPARSVCLVALSLSEAGPGRFGRQVSVIDIYHTILYHTYAMRGCALLENCRGVRGAFIQIQMSHDKCCRN